MRREGRGYEPDGLMIKRGSLEDMVMGTRRRINVSWRASALFLVGMLLAGHEYLGGNEHYSWVHSQAKGLSWLLPFMMRYCRESFHYIFLFFFKKEWQLAHVPCHSASFRSKHQTAFQMPYGIMTQSTSNPANHVPTHQGPFYRSSMIGW